MENKKSYNCRVVHIDLLKFFAALMITNSHLYEFYPPDLSVLGTFGAPGNALFFFSSGYLLSLGSLRSFHVWIKRRICRLWPSIIAWCSLIYPLLFKKHISWTEIWIADGYWFIKCIVIYYVLWYIIVKFFNKFLVQILFLSILISIVVFFSLPWDARSIYSTDFHYFCFFSIMLLGTIVANNRLTEKKKNTTKDVLVMIFSICLFYGIQYVGKGKDTIIYYFQILSYIPLFSLIYYIDKICTYPLLEKIVKSNFLGGVILFVSNITLEIYLVGFVVFKIPNKMIDLFPMNLILVFLLIIFLAYITKVVSVFIIQTFELDRYDWKKMFLAFK